MNKALLVGLITAMVSIFALPVNSQSRQVFDDFPGIPCELLLAVNEKVQDEHVVGWWIHGFLSGAVWAAPNNTGHTKPLVEIKNSIIPLCLEAPKGILTGSVLNRLYEIHSE